MIIPTQQIPDDVSEEQRLAFIETYLDRPGDLVKVLNNFKHFETCHDQQRAVHLIITAMLRHRQDKDIQISGR